MGACESVVRSGTYMRFLLPKMSVSCLDVHVHLLERSLLYAPTLGRNVCMCTTVSPVLERVKHVHRHELRCVGADSCGYSELQKKRIYECREA